jgi:hypothetical protein
VAGLLWLAAFLGLAVVIDLAHYAGLLLRQLWQRRRKRGHQRLRTQARLGATCRPSSSGACHG